MGTLKRVLWGRYTSPWYVHWGAYLGALAVICGVLLLAGAAGVVAIVAGVLVGTAAERVADELWRRREHERERGNPDPWNRAP